MSVTISGLETDIEYEVQIRAKNDEGESDWSDSGRGSTGSTEANAAPRFTSTATPTVPENQTFVLRVEAEDDDSQDSVTGYKIVGGADQGQFDRMSMSSTGDLRFRIVPNFEAPQDVQSATPSNAAGNNEYVVVVRATSGTGDRERTKDQTIVVTVTDETNERPGTPNAPSVSAASQTSLDVRWLEPENEGPAHHRLRLPIQEDERFGARLGGGDEYDNHRVVGDDHRPRRGAPHTMSRSEQRTQTERASGRLREPDRQNRRPTRHRSSPAMRKWTCRRTRRLC